jgi:NodT family efflux transporter outer membrane factor (OMF) lipoprotein
MRISLLVWLSLLAGCASGPDFVRPAVPRSHGYADTAAAAPDSTSATGSAHDAQQVVLGAAVASDWWTLFDCDVLNDLIRQALDASPSVRAAQSTLSQAQELTAAAEGARYPSVNLTGGVGRQKYGKEFLGPLTPPPPFTYFAAGAAVSYTFDVAGGVARSIEERRALFEYQRQELRAAQLALAGNVVGEAIELASAAERIRAINELLEEDRRNLKLVQTSLAAGNTTRVDVLFADSQLANDETLLPPAAQQLTLARHALAVLVGHAPADWSPPELDFGRLTLPGTLPVSLPSELVHQRPDILAAEAALHAATAQVGVATANLYPHLTLTGSAGQQALTLGTLFAGGNGVWTVASGLTAPIFDGGTLRAERRADIDALHASAASYEEAVLQGLRQVADVLAGIDHDAELLAAETHAVDAAQASLNLARESYRAGNVGVLQVLDAERAYSRARLDYVRVAAQRYSDTAQLYLALGGTAP